MKATLYARFSPRPNSAECDSCEKQLADLREYCRKHSIVIKAEYKDEAMSGADADRPGLWDALKNTDKGEVIVFRSWDRLARDVYLTEFIKAECRKRKIKLISITNDGKDSPENTLIQQILSAFYEYQRQIIKAKTRASMQRYQNKDFRAMSARPPYGFRTDGKKLIPVPEEQKIVDSIISLHKQHRKHCDIVRDLKDLGYKTRMGKDFYQSNVVAILKRNGYDYQSPKK